MSEKILIYILALLLELVRDYWVAKSSFQKVEAQKEKKSLDSSSSNRGVYPGRKDMGWLQIV